MRIEPAAAFGADAAPLAEQQGAAEQVGPDLHAVEAPLVALRAGCALSEAASANSGSCTGTGRAGRGLARLGMFSREV